jgi:hypothetical protein
LGDPHAAVHASVSGVTAARTLGHLCFGFNACCCCVLAVQEPAMSDDRVQEVLTWLGLVATVVAVWWFVPLQG